MKSGLLSLWEFEGTVNDSIGSNNLTVTGTTAYADPWLNVGQGFSFNGTTDMSKTTPSSLSPANTITVGVVCKIAATASLAYIVDRIGATEGFGLAIAATSSYPTVGINGAFVATGSAAIDDGNLHFVMYTYDKDAGGTTEVKLYVDNVQVATGDYSTAIDYSPDPNLVIGGTGGANRLPNGSIIYQVAVWDRVLTSTERTIWYGGGNGYNFQSNGHFF